MSVRASRQQAIRLATGTGRRGLFFRIGHWSPDFETVSGSVDPQCVSRAFRLALVCLVRHSRVSCKNGAASFIAFVFDEAMNVVGRAQYENGHWTLMNGHRDR